MGILNKLISNIFGNNKSNQNMSNYGQQTNLTQQNIKTEPYNEYMIYKGNSTYPNDYIVFDFETTGLNPREDKIIQIGALKYRNNEKIDEFIIYVNPQKPTPSNITTLTGIRNSDVKNAPTISQILPEFIDFIGEDSLIAHNADFDMKFLLNNTFNLKIKKPQNEVIDTLSLSRKFIKDENGIKLDNYKLPTLKGFLGIVVGSHNSADDCLVCAEVYKKCKEKINNSTKPKSKVNVVADDKTLLIELQCFDNVKQMLLSNNKSTC